MHEALRELANSISHFRIAIAVLLASVLFSIVGFFVHPTLAVELRDAKTGQPLQAPPLTNAPNNSDVSMPGFVLSAVNECFQLRAADIYEFSAGNGPTVYSSHEFDRCMSRYAADDVVEAVRKGILNANGVIRSVKADAIYTVAATTPFIHVYKNFEKGVFVLQADGVATFRSLKGPSSTAITIQVFVRREASRDAGLLIDAIQTTPRGF